MASGATARLAPPVAAHAMTVTAMPVVRHGRVTAVAAMAAGLVVTVTAVVVRAAVPVTAVVRKAIVPVAVGTGAVATRAAAPMLTVPAGATRARPGARRTGRKTVPRFALQGVVTRALTATAMAVRPSPLKAGPVRAVVAVRRRAAVAVLVSTARADLRGRAIPALAGDPTIGRGLAVRAAQLSPAVAVRTGSPAAGQAGAGMTGQRAAQTAVQQAA